MRLRWLTASLLASASACVLFGCNGVLPEDRAAACLARGQSHLERGDLDAALAELAQAVRANPKLSVAYAAIGDIHRRRGENEKARDAYESACKADPYAFRPHYNLGVTYQLLASAAKAIDKAAEYLRKAVQVYIRAVNLRPNDFETNLNLSACYYHLCRYELAEKYSRAAVRIRPQSPQAFSNLGIILDAQGRFDDATKAYHESLELDVDQPDLLVNLGSIYLKQDHPQSALRSFVLAVGKDPKNALAWEYLGLARFRLREYERSLEAYRQAAALDPKNPTLQRAVGVVSMTLFLLNPQQAELRDRALHAWRLSLAVKADQPDLLRLLRKYTPGVTGPGLGTPDQP